ncbi:hypothetical protein B0T22DRAFT_448725 [Podospora appendiculata]|uniref:Uncharacterized protein n=1 Tax=Podospora appendiculata TaxID=314037 RepID=A0AAE0XGT7_9PEZI|nr:hypothetical protein B0T22DRAFT_448725 [Podospora appendiculata]
MSDRPPPQAHSYNEDEVIATLTAFYKFFLTLPWPTPPTLLSPPPDGWAHITPGNFAWLGKNATVLSLLRRLPYIRQENYDEVVVDFETYPADYRRPYYLAPHDVARDGNPYEVPETGHGGVPFPPWVVPLTYGKNKGKYWMLDTTDGTVTNYEVTACNDAVFADDDPRAWRNACVEPGSARPLAEVVDHLRKEYEGLVIVNLPRWGAPFIWTEGVEGFSEVQDIMRHFGWPADFDREGCRDALIAWQSQQD